MNTPKEGKNYIYALNDDHSHSRTRPRRPSTGHKSKPNAWRQSHTPPADCHRPRWPHETRSAESPARTSRTPCATRRRCARISWPAGSALTTRSVSSRTALRSCGPESRPARCSCRPPPARALRRRRRRRRRPRPRPLLLHNTLCCLRLRGFPALGLSNKTARRRSPAQMSQMLQHKKH